ncbi:MAG: sigma-70 family RNA polymerase sigma factor [Planctomycetes bacterium]|nr:sigma-70 family RNA polymerase sigma factor [Planctomycetota bacterium]
MTDPRRVDPIIDVQKVPADETLMSRVATGDLGAFEHLVLRHQGSAWNAAVRFLGDPAEAEDIVQESFLRVLRGATSYQPIASFRTYLFRIVHRLCVDFQEKKRPLTVDDVPDRDDGRPTACEAASRTDEQREVQAAIARLPASQRMATVLRYYEGLGYAEIAQVMELTEKAVERLLARARAALQESLLPGRPRSLS